ncbi:type IV secretion system protein VirB5 [Povalibacter uvarum]|uniref:Type IV secretion system protein VirB5 n=1 Tax=Povalibacter uvarum TaxID=732238 RepID=A0A841HQV5_9GAMM|nr:type IV secretion system protein [Povalibacter uvarum]MBB6095014.1 type IV secretion system protein VirB5 [Povalibacter uvarum]
MTLLKVRQLLISIVLSLGITPVANAQWAVVDVGAIAQLVQQVNTMRQQLETTRDQLQQARVTLDSMRGGRGMEQLLAGTARNYLPSDWQELAAVLDEASASYSTLATELQRLINANAILTPQQIGALSPAERSQLEAARRSAAMLQALTREALSATSRRFGSIQQLIDAIPQAGDQKAILDLQARIQAEQGMLQNEATKLGVLYQAAQAEEWARKQRVREQAIASIGSLRDLPPMGL